MSLAILKIRLYGDPCLRVKSTPVDKVGPGERILIESMFATMHQAKGVGLAAPQVGINRRIFVVDVDNNPLAIINPKITQRNGRDSLEEGCLSIPEVTVAIERPEQITVKFMDEHGEMKEMTCDGLLARVIQHETDHLDGKLIVDYAGPKEKSALKDKLKALEAEQKNK